MRANEHWSLENFVFKWPQLNAKCVKEEHFYPQIKTAKPFRPSLVQAALPQLRHVQQVKGVRRRGRTPKFPAQNSFQKCVRNS